MNARDEAALALWQANRTNPEREALLDQLYGCSGMSREATRICSNPVARAVKSAQHPAHHEAAP